MFQKQIRQEVLVGAHQAELAEKHLDLTEIWMASLAQRLDKVIGAFTNEERHIIAFHQGSIKGTAALERTNMQ